jgi:hypothetical protein
MVQQQQQQALRAACIAGGRDALLDWRGLQMLPHEGKQFGLAKTRPATQLVLTAESLQVGFGELIELEVRDRQQAGALSEEGVVTVVEALGLAVEVGVETAGVAGKEAAEGV